jgi:hypothetical protein
MPLLVLRSSFFILFSLLSSEMASVTNESLVLQTFAFSCFWREKDYGEGVLEEWHFTLRCRDNLGNAHLFSFWGSYVYFESESISFGYNDSPLSILKKGNHCFLQWRLFDSTKNFRLAIPFEEVVTKLKAALVDIEFGDNLFEQDSAVYQFPMGSVPEGMHPDKYIPPPIYISLI